jgi:hypothetical protein
MNRSSICLIVCVILLCIQANAQTKVVGECTIQYAIFQQQGIDTLPIGQKLVMVKGTQCKTILTTPQLIQTLIFNAQSTKATITKEIGETRFLQEINYPPLNTPTLLSMKETTIDSVFIQGYACKRVELKWSDGSKYEIFYTSDIIPTVSAFELAFKEVPGLVLSYTITTENGVAVKYLATKVDLSPISLSQFNVNTSLFQIID